MPHSKLSIFLRQLFLDKQSYLNVLYTFMTMLLGCFYLLPLLLLLPGSANPACAPLVWAALLLILLTLSLSPTLVTLERFIIRALLGLRIPAPIPEKERSAGRRLSTFMGRGVNWKHLLYIYGKASAGMFVAAMLIVLLIAGFALFCGSLIYSIVSAGDALSHQLLGAATELEQLQLWFIVIHARPFAGIGQLPWPLALVRLVLTALAGLLLFTGAFYLNNMLIGAWKRFACSTLIASKKDLQLLEARRQAEQARQQAELANQKRRELITNVSHELRTPVSSIQGHIEALLHTSENAKTPPPALNTLHQYLDIVYRESLQLGTLVDDLLALARAETDELQLQREAVDAAEVIAQVYQALMPLAHRERQITLLQEVEAGLPPLLADRQRLTQILLNLVRNAITNTQDGGLVSITLQRADNSFLALQVADTGIGIPQEEQKHIFERFYRADASRSRSSGGAGLGLAIVREFVQAMEGSISVESKVGEGSTFRVLLPIAPGQ